MKGPEARDALVSFERGMSCDRLRPSVHAALDRLAALPPADAAKQDLPKAGTEKEINTEELVGAAQSELHRLGCLDDRHDGKLDKPTRVALDKYYEAHKKPVPNKVDIKIDDDFLSELKAEKGPACVVASLPPDSFGDRRKPPRPPADIPIVKHPPREETHPPSRAAERAPPPPKEHYSPPPRSTAGGGGYSGGGGGSNMGGVGF
jgi:hypothetical protein